MAFLDTRVSVEIFSPLEDQALATDIALLVKERANDQQRLEHTQLESRTKNIGYHSAVVACLGQKGTLLSTGAIDLLENREARIDDIATRAGYERQHLGSAVMKALEIFALSQCMQRVTLRPRKGSIPFYTAMGYEPSYENSVDLDYVKILF